jgi:hypothetical protein
MKKKIGCGRVITDVSIGAGTNAKVYHADVAGATRGSARYTRPNLLSFIIFIIDASLECPLSKESAS